MGGYKEKLYMNPILMPPVLERCLVELVEMWNDD